MNRLDAFAITGLCILAGVLTLVAFVRLGAG